MSILRSIADSWRNLQTGLNGSYAKHKQSYYSSRERLSFAELSDLYENNGLASRVADRLPDDATREGFTIIGADKDFDWEGLQSDIEDFRVLPTLADAVRWSRVFGGSLIAAAVNDGRKYHEPLDLMNLTGIVGFQVIDASMVTPGVAEPGLGARGFLQPNHYTIAVGRGNRDVHWSRAWRFDAVKVPARSLINNRWGPSVYQRIYDALARLGVAYASASEMMHTASLMVLQMQGFRAAIESGDEEKLRKVLDEIRDGLSNLNVLAIDKEDQFYEVKRTLADVSQLIDRFELAFVSETDMPKELVLNVTEGGMNSGENTGPFRMWYDKVHVFQQQELTPALNWMLDIIFARRRHLGKPVPTQWTIEWSPLWQMDDAQKADLHLKKAQGDQIYFMIGSITSDEIRRSRFGSDSSTDIEIEPEPELDFEDPMEPDPAEAQQTPTEPVESIEQPPEGESLLSPGEIGERLGVSANSIIRMHRKGKIPGWKVNGRWRFAASHVQEEVFRPARGPNGEEI